MGKLSEFLATCDRFFLAGIGPVQSKTIMFNRKYRPVTRSASQQSSAEAVVTHPPVQVTAPVPDSVQVSAQTPLAMIILQLLQGKSTSLSKTGRLTGDSTLAKFL